MAGCPARKPCTPPPTSWHTDFKLQDILNLYIPVGRVSLLNEMQLNGFLLTGGELVLPQQRIFIGDGDKDGLNMEPSGARVERSDSAPQQLLSPRILHWDEKADTGHAAALAVHQHWQEQQEKQHFWGDN